MTEIKEGHSMGKLDQKVAIITGGGTGIGRNIALEFAKQGAKVVIGSRNMASLEKVVEEIKALGGHSLAIATDVSVAEQVRSLVKQTVDNFGRIDILVNNAGIVISRPFMEKTVEDWIRTLEVNLIGVFLCSQAAAKYMLQQKSGKIINISSIRGIDHCGREGIMDYSASKGAVINLTKTMAKELAPHINVNTVAPGHTLTEMTQPLPDEIKRTMIEGSYLKRMAQPEDIAKAIIFLASDDANFITGQLLLVDGGFSLK
jgi:3-oxoacyl-[acyl-carrier protein] reductase